MKALLLIFTLLTTSTLLAGPPFNYPAAVAWAEQSTVSDIPKAKRIYLFTTLPSPASGKSYATTQPESHQAIRILPHRAGLSLGEVLDKPLPGLEVRIYRAAKPIDPVLVLDGAKAHESKFPVQPLDVIEVRPPIRGLIL